MHDRILGQRAVGAQPSRKSDGAPCGSRVAVDSGRRSAGPLVQLAELVTVRLHPLVPVGERVGLRQPLRHRQLVVRAVLEAVEARLQVEDRPAVLDRHDAEC